MSTILSDDNKTRKLSKKIQKQLEQLKNDIVYGFPEDKKEVVFLPYKASMWDSLESVWKVANEDENCDAYVIPIPYFDKNPDGSFRMMHYEGSLYPDYVPVTHWEQYDFEGRRPDVIFIHNPYDANNRVTSVDPFFYTRNLKQYTENLVYIPYFILNEVSPNNKAATKKIEDFCLTSAVLVADKVIVQSEDMRQIYINILTEQMGNTVEVKEYWAQKILGLGSPKIDKVLNTRKEDINVPNDWWSIIKKPDGSLKKIILYNTSVKVMLEHEDLVINKLKYVFTMFGKKKDDLALLWRPHPLIEATIKSMRSQVWEQYKSLRDEYIREAWGIYDDTADMNRAVVLSDAYYGDPSSLVQLFEQLKKPIMIQNLEIGVNE